MGVWLTEDMNRPNIPPNANPAPPAMIDFAAHDSIPDCICEKFCQFLGSKMQRCLGIAYDFDHLHLLVGHAIVRILARKACKATWKCHCDTLRLTNEKINGKVVANRS